MLLIKKGQENNLTVTCSQNKSGDTPFFYLFSFEHSVSKEKVRFYATTLLSNDRYDEFIFNEVTSTATTPDPLNADVEFAQPGQYYYSIYEMGTKTLDPSTARQKLEEGRALVYDVVNPEYYTEYISSNENNSNYIYLD